MHKCASPNICVAPHSLQTLGRYNHFADEEMKAPFLSHTANIGQNWCLNPSFLYLHFTGLHQSPKTNKRQEPSSETI